MNAGRWRLRLILLAAIAGAARAASPLVPPAVPRLWTPPLPLPGDADAHHFANGAEMLGDITYSTIAGYRPLKLDLYLPSSVRSPKPLPVVVWVHGGGYVAGNPRADWTWGDWTQVLAKLAVRGYAVAAISYRFSGEARFPAQIDDVRAALEFLRKNAAPWNLDGSRVYIWGLSAGGQLAALAGMESAHLPPDQRVQGVVDWFGPTDFTTTKPSPALMQLFGCPASGCDPQILKAASPVTYVTPAAPPTLIMQGEADHLVPPSQSRELYDRLTAVRADVTLRTYPGLGHGFAGASRAQLDQILNTTFAWFDQQSGQSPSH